MTGMATTLDSDTLRRALAFAISLLALLVAHQVGDHVMQSDRQTAGKSGAGLPAWRAMVGHLLGYHVTAAAMLLGTAAAVGMPLTTAGVVAGLAFSAITHGILDRRWPVAAVLRATGAPNFARATTPLSGMQAADQALHQLALLISALFIAAL